MSAFFGGDLCGFSVHSHLTVPTRFKCVMLLIDASVLIKKTKEPPSEMLPGDVETRGQRKLPSENPVDKGIYLSLHKIKEPGTYLNFTVTWNNSLALKHGSEIMVPFAGPYVLYFCALVKGKETKGNLTLLQGRTSISFELPATKDNRCVRHQKVISLYEKEKVTFSFRNTYEPYLYLQVLNVGLQYLLGAQDFETPEYDPLD
ncbi:hypothetical protein Baya_15059 [Bagarius yarrelli]|uniref:Uncharacterized protein n=1 Tax=Bagarius yarrelli TaxID=175774 RepID=A0A556VAI7_BAGYA|nr:hypothetical protein Baya_15059 [Bagarius yarrelli]